MTAAQLISYPDRLAPDLAALADLLDGPLHGVFGGVHVLPFFDPIDGADAGFDPIDHRRVDPRIGTWSDIARLADERTVMADLIVNHVSARSAQFLDVLAHGSASQHRALFLDPISDRPNLLQRQVFLFKRALRHDGQSSSTQTWTSMTFVWGSKW